LACHRVVVVIGFAVVFAVVVAAAIAAIAAMRFGGSDADGTQQRSPC
jgi:hypothetical protein